MIKLSDYACNFLSKKGIKDVFMISGGGAMHMVDSVGRHPKLNYVCPHHEQAAAIAAEGYYRASGRIAAVVVTSGPGGTNTLTGVIGQWLDSIPCIYISGQVKQETTIASCPEVGLRQLGDQEINIVDIVRPVTKYAVMVRNPLEIRYHLEKAYYLATHGRPGPVWLDIPLDIQSAMIDEKKLLTYDETEDELKPDKDDIQSKISQTIKLLKKAKRPIFIAGHGIRLSGAQELFLEAAKRMGIPVVSTFNGFDLIDSDNPLYVGRIGTIGDRAGNFALQNSDLLISVGSRNNIRQVSYNWKSFARAAKKVVVDIDQAELNKPTLRPDIAIHADVGYFLGELRSQLEKENLPSWAEWCGWCAERKERYPVVLPEYRKERGYVNPYYFVQTLSECLRERDVVVTGNGTASVVYFQTGVVKKGQRVVWNSGCASMGYDLPAAIGASIGLNKKKVVCIAGDGSLQMNIQELQTVHTQNLPLKIFYLNNQGYVSIKQTQDSFFEGRRVACDKASGVSLPDISKVAGAYGLLSEVITNHNSLKEKIRKMLAGPSAVVCDVRLSPEYKFAPKLSSEKRADGKIISKPLEDMYPFLDRQEFKSNMLVPEWNPDEV
jgi:acetolactate synthase-1/2/3 large subunit